MHPTARHACPLPTAAALAILVSLPLEESAFPATSPAALFAPPRTFALSAPPETRSMAVVSVSVATSSSALPAVPTTSALSAATT